jgi:hypothetical protein
VLVVFVRPLQGSRVTVAAHALLKVSRRFALKAVGAQGTLQGVHGGQQLSALAHVRTEADGVDVLALHVCLAGEAAQQQRGRPALVEHVTTSHNRKDGSDLRAGELITGDLELSLQPGVGSVLRVCLLERFRCQRTDIIGPDHLLHAVLVRWHDDVGLWVRPRRDRMPEVVHEKRRAQDCVPQPRFLQVLLDAPLGLKLGDAGAPAPAEGPSLLRAAADGAVDEVPHARALGCIDEVPPLLHLPVHRGLRHPVVQHPKDAAKGPGRRVVAMRRAACHCERAIQGQRIIQVALHHDHTLAGELLRLRRVWRARQAGHGEAKAEALARHSPALQARGAGNEHPDLDTAIAVARRPPALALGTGRGQRVLRRIRERAAASVRVLDQLSPTGAAVGQGSIAAVGQH